MKKKLGFLLATLLIFGGGCNSTPTTPQSLNKDLTFIDTELFDKDLLASMSQESEAITVKMIGPVSINHIPNRLSKWFGAIKEKEGRVNIDPKITPSDSSSKLPIALVVGLLPTAYSYLKNERSYGPAVNYDVTISYDPDTGMVKKVLFTHKNKK